jgi:hypothetical protein
VALYFRYYNFGRVHQTLRVSPTMEDVVSDHAWSTEEIVGLLNNEIGKGDRMDRLFVTLFALTVMAVQCAGIFAIVYFGARLAIRHERRASN